MHTSGSVARNASSVPLTYIRSQNTVRSRRNTAAYTSGVTFFTYICSPKCITRKRLVVSPVKTHGMGHRAKIPCWSLRVESYRALDGNEEGHRAILSAVRAAGVVWVDLDTMLRLPHLTQLGEWCFDAIRLTPCFIDSGVDLIVDEWRREDALAFHLATTKMWISMWKTLRHHYMLWCDRKLDTRLILARIGQ